MVQLTQKFSTIAQISPSSSIKLSTACSDRCAERHGGKLISCLEIFVNLLAVTARDAMGVMRDFLFELTFT